MKKIFLTLTAVSAVLLAPMTFAETTQASKSYSITQIKGTALPMMRAAMFDPTNIFVLNFTDYNVYAYFNGTGTGIGKGNSVSFKDKSDGYTNLELSDYAGVVFHSENVCRYAIVSVYYNNGFRAKVDRSYC